MQKPIIFWFRQDLRTYDLPGLTAAAATGRPLILCYILDDTTPGDWAPGGASRWWLHYSLQALAKDVSQLGGELVLRRGETQAVLQDLLQETGAAAIHCTRQYEPWAIELEQNLHLTLDQRGIVFKRFAGNLLFEPGRILNQAGLPFKVFTPFWRNCRKTPEPMYPQPAPVEAQWYLSDVSSDALGSWQLRPARPDWAAGWQTQWQPGTAGARDKLKHFLSDKIHDYSDGRNHPALESTTRLSPHLHFGEVSPREVWHAAERLAQENPAVRDQVDKFLSELGWREFSHHLLYHFPTIESQPFKAKFSNFPWLGRPDSLVAWQQGQTGYPMVDAGMRELWQTGFMHNRVRMIVASFLTKHLLIHWGAGARWFWDTLLDADLANNSSGWQWVAGSGADASPYFRIFNPVTQGEKFDKQGRYIRRWVPELSAMPDRYLNCPWEAPADMLDAAGVTLGKSYPSPIVDHRAAREAALSAYGSIR
jgi:deoxyribodipyrimidine photo-lyase